MSRAALATRLAALVACFGCGVAGLVMLGSEKLALGVALLFLGWGLSIEIRFDAARLRAEKLEARIAESEALHKKAADVLSRAIARLGAVGMTTDAIIANAPPDHARAIFDGLKVLAADLDKRLDADMSAEHAAIGKDAIVENLRFVEKAVGDATGKTKEAP